MKIISQFKDYYDYQATMYGGGDPNIVYHRKPLGALCETNSLRYYKNVEQCLPKYARFQHEIRYRILDAELQYLVVCGTAYPIIALRNSNGCSGTFVMYDPEQHSKYVADVSRYAGEHIPSYVQSSRLIDLSIALGHPVFIVTRVRYDRDTSTSTYSIAGDCPKLSSLGFASLSPPEKLYQDLSYFVGNTMLSPSPDNMPIVPMTDREKILSHGLDPKKSFRHRK